METGIAVIFWLDTSTFTVSAMPRWLAEAEPTGACRAWVDHVLSMGWALWAACL